MRIGAQKTAATVAAAKPSLLDRLNVRLGRARRPATAFVSQPQPQAVGSFARGKQLIAGNFQFAGSLVEHPDTVIWDLPFPDQNFELELHGFEWLDDLAAVGDGAARRAAQEWLFAWLDRFGTGKGPGWSPDLIGRRLIRWITHAVLLMNGQTPEKNTRYFQSLADQAGALGRSWSDAAPGLPRVEALTGLIYAGISLEGMEPLLGSASQALAHECDSLIDQSGGLPTRNPEELLEVFTLLHWAKNALAEGERDAPAELEAARTRIAPALRSLRHSDGGLARFHGGGRGREGQLDQGLSSSHATQSAPAGIHMGFARLAFARTSVIIDAAPPPLGVASLNAHASTLAFELTSARRPLIVNCGSGAPFGEEWRRAGRATPSHSTLAIDGVSSAKLRRSRLGEQLSSPPKRVTAQLEAVPGGARAIASHNGYASFGLHHVRKLELTADGRMLTGEDSLAALSDVDRATFDVHMDKVALAGVPYKLRFHLHPDVDPSLDLGGTAISLSLKSGEVWVFRARGARSMTIEPSVFLEKGRLRPRATKQIVLSSVVMEYASQVSWVLAKAQDVPHYLRDHAEEEPPLAPLT